MSPRRRRTRPTRTPPKGLPAHPHTGPGPARAVTATEAAKRFGALVDRVREQRAAFTIERGGTAVARLEPADMPHCTLRELANLLDTLKRPDQDYPDEVERAVAEFNRPALPGTPWES